MTHGDGIKKGRNLAEGSELYHSKVKVYKEFSDVQDKPMKLLKFLKPKLRGKAVLDIGCGNGRYASLLAGTVRQYVGVDNSSEQLCMAKKTARKHKNVRFMLSPAERLPLPSESMDVVVSIWGAMSVAVGSGKQAKILKEAYRVLKKGGSIYIARSAPDDEWASLKRYRQTKKVWAYREWLVRKGFKVTEISTHFHFKSKNDARRIVRDIYGAEVAGRITSRIIKRRILLFSGMKA